MPYVNWQESFNPDFYYYPYMEFVDLGVKVHPCSGKGDTFIQQLLQDLPADLCEEIVLKPALTYPILSSQYLDAVKAKVEYYGIDPKEQFLHFNVQKHPHQHQHVSYSEKFVKEDIDGYFSGGHSMCLRTPANVHKGIKPKCYQCGSCEAIDKVCAEENIKETLTGGEFKTHKQWMLTRELQTHYDISDIRTSKLKNAPSFYYTFIFKYNKNARLISKENLLRQWLKQAAMAEESLVTNFRKIHYFTAKYIDYDGLASNYYGYDLVTLGFRDALPENIQEAFDKANENCSGVQMLKWFEDYSTTANKYKLLFEISFDADTEEMAKIIDLYKTEDFRIYSENVQYPEFVSFPFDYKVIRTPEGLTKFYIIMPAVCNPAYTLMSKYNFNKLQSIVKDMKVMSILSETSSSSYYDIIKQKEIPTSGFIHVDKSVKDREELEETLEAEGA